MNKKLLVVAIFAVAAVAAMADVTASTASSVAQNIGATNNQAAATNTINAAVAAAQQAPVAPVFTGTVSSMMGFTQDQGRSPNYDNPNAVNLNYQMGNFTYSLNGALEFQGTNHSSNALANGDYNSMLNSWGGTVGYNWQNGLTTSVAVNYLNWRNQQSGTGVYPVLVTGYQFAPNLTFVNGNNTFAVAMNYEVIGSSNGINAINSTSGITSSTVTPNWGGQKGELFSIFPVYTNKITPNFSYGTGIFVQQANDNYVLLSDAVNNGNGNEIVLHPAMLSYNVASIPGLNLNLDTRYYYYDSVKGDAVSQAGSNIAGTCAIRILPGIAYTMNITPDLSWTTNAQVYGKWYTAGSASSSTPLQTMGAYNFGGQVYSGFNYSF